MFRLGWMASLVLLTWPTAELSAAPFVFYRGVLNAASFVPPGLPSGDVARGSIFSVFGRDLGPAEGAQVAAFPLGTELAGVSIEVCQGEQCVAAIPLFVRADQINAIMPSNAPLGDVSLRVRFNEQSGNWLNVRVTQASLGIFTVNSGGFGPGVVQNFVSSAEQPINSATATARPGQVVTLWGTGLGPGLNADSAAPQAGDLPTAVEIWVGGVPVTNVLYSGRTPCCAGVDQIVFEIPADVPGGCYVPVEARLNGQVVSNTTTVAIAASGSCSDAGGEVMAALRAGGRTGLVTLLRQTQYTEQAAPLTIQETDIAVGEFRADQGGPFTYHPDWSLPPPGTCITQSVRGAVLDRVPKPGTLPTIGRLDAGESLTIATPGGAVAVGKQAGRAHEYLALLGARLNEGAISTLAQGDGGLQVTGSGGADVAAFGALAPAPANFQWTNRSDLIEIERDEAITLTWSGASAGGRVWISGGVSDFRTDSATTFSCLADVSAGSFTLPEQTIARLPALPIRRSRAKAWLSMGLLSPAGAVAFAADGLDRGFAGSFRQIIQTVRYR